MVELKDLKDYPGYKAGSYGHIYSYKNIYPRKLKSHTYSTGKYLFVGLRKDGKTYLRSVHRLICETFNGKPNENQDASHLDGNDKNNLPENLIWENRSKNCHRKKEHGTDDIGVKNKRAMFNIEQIIQIKKWLSEGVTCREIGKRMNCNDRNIGKIKRGEHYRGQGETK